MEINKTVTFRARARNCECQALQYIIRLISTYHIMKNPTVDIPLASLCASLDLHVRASSSLVTFGLGPLPFGCDAWSTCLLGAVIIIIINNIIIIIIITMLVMSINKM